jgi:integrase
MPSRKPRFAIGLEWTRALLHAATAARPEEAFGLKLENCDWKEGQINIRRGWKARARLSRCTALAESLQEWRKKLGFENSS